MLDNLLHDIDSQIEMFVRENYKALDRTTFAACGFDTRAMPRSIWASDQGFVVRGHTRSFDYYGGMEYVKDDDRKQVGDWTFYLAEQNSRVQGHLDRGGIAEFEGEEEDEE
jgi:hypothetical protein